MNSLCFKENVLQGHFVYHYLTHILCPIVSSARCDGQHVDWLSFISQGWTWTFSVVSFQYFPGNDIFQNKVNGFNKIPLILILSQFLNLLIIRVFTYLGLEPMKSGPEEIRLVQSRTADSSALPPHGRRRRTKWEVAVEQVQSRISSKSL